MNDGEGGVVKRRRRRAGEGRWMDDVVGLCMVNDVNFHSYYMVGTVLNSLLRTNIFLRFLSKTSCKNVFVNHKNLS